MELRVHGRLHLHPGGRDERRRQRVCHELNPRGIDGATNIGSEDTFLIKFTPDGDRLWSRQVGSFTADVGYSAPIDGRGAYIAGATDSGLNGANRGVRDIFLMRLVPEPNASLLFVLAGCSLRRRGRRRG